MADKRITNAREILKDSKASSTMVGMGISIANKMVTTPTARKIFPDPEKRGESIVTLLVAT
jgi:hypothetical protein